MKSRHANNPIRVPAAAATAAAVAVALLVTLSGGQAQATRAAGVSSNVLATGHFGAINVRVRTDLDTGDDTDFWRASLRTKGASDLQIIENTVAPGGSFGWHSHPGPSLIIVKSGTATYFEGDDPSCTPHVVEAGSGIVDSGTDTHVIRNDSYDGSTR